MQVIKVPLIATLLAIKKILVHRSVVVVQMESSANFIYSQLHWKDENKEIEAWNGQI